MFIQSPFENVVRNYISLCQCSVNGTKLWFHSSYSTMLAQFGLVLMCSVNTPNVLAVETATERCFEDAGMMSLPRSAPNIHIMSWSADKKQ